MRTKRHPISWSYWSDDGATPLSNGGRGAKAFVLLVDDPVISGALSNGRFSNMVDQRGGVHGVHIGLMSVGQQ